MVKWLVCICLSECGFVGFEAGLWPRHTKDAENTFNLHVLSGSRHVRIYWYFTLTSIRFGFTDIIRDLRPAPKKVIIKLPIMFYTNMLYIFRIDLSTLVVPVKTSSYFKRIFKGMLKKTQVRLSPSLMYFKWWSLMNHVHVLRIEFVLKYVCIFYNM